MKRRELIKAGLLSGVASIGLCGCSDKEIAKSDEITPKQTAVYKILTPLPFDFKLIDEINNLNKTYKKSQILDLYNSIPAPLADIFGNNFQSKRGENSDIKSVDDYIKYVKYAKDLGFNNVYILNSPRGFTEDEFEKYRAKLFNMIDSLIKAGCNTFKVANTQLLSILDKEYKNDINLSASTSFEYHNISQFENLLETYPSIKSINIATDDNKNFDFLRNLKKALNRIDIEIMVNENCIHGCAGRISHPQSHFCKWPCQQIKNRIGVIPYFMRSNSIYPWDLEYYSAIGVNSFKIVSIPLRSKIENIDYLRNYLNCAEYGIDNLTAKDFFTGIYRLENTNIKKNIKLSELKKYLPDMKHFVKNGHKCANDCKVSCNYCFDCIEKVKKALVI